MIRGRSLGGHRFIISTRLLHFVGFVRIHVRNLRSNRNGCVQSWNYPGPHQDEEPGPSGGGRNLENDLSLVGEVPWKGPEHGTKSRVKGKAPASSLQHSFQDKSTGIPQIAKWTMKHRMGCFDFHAVTYCVCKLICIADFVNA